MKFQDYFIQANLVYIIGCVIFMILIGTPIIEFTKNAFFSFFVYIRLKLFPYCVFDLISQVVNPFDLCFPDAFIVAVFCYKINKSTNKSLADFYSFFIGEQFDPKEDVSNSVNKIIEQLLASATLERTINWYFARYPQEFFVQFNLHQEYFAMQSIAEYPFFPKSIREYCTKQCSQYRNNWKNNRKNIVHAFKGITKSKTKQENQMRQGVRSK